MFKSFFLRLYRGLTRSHWSANPFLLVLVIGSAFFLGNLWQRNQRLNDALVAANTKNSAPTQPTTVPDNAATRAILTLKDTDHILGDPNAPTRLFVYSDFECPYCKQFAPVLQSLADDSTRKVAIIYRHFPLSFHANAFKEAVASECVTEQGGNTAFWKYETTIFQRTTSNGTGFALDQLAPLATELNLDPAAFTTCLNSSKYTDRINQEEKDGTSLGINGTPSSVITNRDNSRRQLIVGNTSLSTLQQAVDQLKNN